AHVEAGAFGTRSAYSRSELEELLARNGGLCVLLFANDGVIPGEAWSFALCIEREARDGTKAQQLVTIATLPDKSGQGLGPRLDERCEEIAREQGYKLRVLRSRAPSYIYAEYGGRVGGSPHGEATRFALKRGFEAMPIAQARNFFGEDLDEVQPFLPVTTARL